jgi:exopolysaccharide biosynthesis protein
LNKNKVIKIIRQAVVFLVFQLFFIGVTCPLLAFYGPYQNVKQAVVGSIMETGRHQYIAKLFLSDKQINSIIGTKDSSVRTKNMDTSKFKINNKVELLKLNDNKSFSGYALVVHNPKRVKIGYSMDFNLPNMSLDALASRYNAIGAINAGGFSLEHYNMPGGFIISGGIVKYNESKDYNKKEDAMGITKNGKMIVGSYSINDLKQLNVSEAVCFGPALVVEGKGVVTKDDRYRMSQRTAIGQKADGTILMVVTDGRLSSSFNFGASLKDIQDLMLQYGAVTAYNLDGGGSTSMYYNGDNLKFDNSNKLLIPTGRAIPSIVYIK